MKTKLSNANPGFKAESFFLSNTRKVVYKKIYLILSMFLISLMYFGCEKFPPAVDESFPSVSGISHETTTGGYKSPPFCEVNLLAPQETNVGTVTTTFNDEGDELTVVYEVTTTEWCLIQTHLDIEVDPANFPMTPGGNPKVGQFAYGALLDCTTEWEQIIDLSTISGWIAGATIYIAANAELKKEPHGEEAAWGEGEQFPGHNRWAMYFSCKAPCPASFTYDGQTYSTVLIGDQCWMAENLNVGTMINSHPGGQLQTNNGLIEKFCFGDDLANCAVYGGLYEWDEAMNYVTDEGAQGICPTGWHIPSTTEWQTLSAFLGGDDVSGGKMKEEGTINWSYPNTGATNSSGFTALPGGYRHDLSGDTYDLGIIAHFWSSSQVYYLDGTIGGWRSNLDYDNDNFGPGDGNKPYGFSVRCVKDEN
jgi:uncharacterized protein (TIGR02145 family)